MVKYRIDYSQVPSVMQEVAELIKAEQKTFKPADYLAAYPPVPSLSFEVSTTACAPTKI